MKLQIQFAAVDIDEPFWRALRGKISDGYTQTVAWKPIVKAPWKMNNMAAAPIPAVSAARVSMRAWGQWL